MGGGGTMTRGGFSVFCSGGFAMRDFEPDGLSGIDP